LKCTNNGGDTMEYLRLYTTLSGISISSSKAAGTMRAATDSGVAMLAVNSDTGQYVHLTTDATGKLETTGSGGGGGGGQQYTTSSTSTGNKIGTLALSRVSATPSATVNTFDGLYINTSGGLYTSPTFFGVHGNMYDTPTFVGANNGTTSIDCSHVNSITVFGELVDNTLSYEIKLQHSQSNVVTEFYDTNWSYFTTGDGTQNFSIEVPTANARYYRLYVTADTTFNVVTIAGK